jgi:hypothetical protein
LSEVQLDLDEDEARALLNLLIDAIEADHYPMSPRIRMLKDILMKFGEIGGLSPELAQRLRRYTTPAPAPRPPPKVYEPPRVSARQRRGR